MFKFRRLFPYLLFFFIVVSAVFSLSLSNVSKKRVVLKQKAAEEQQQLPVSEWVPIELSSLNQEIDKEVAELTEKLTKNPTLKQKDILNRSLQIKQITKEEHNLMDENKDGKIDYQEFNLRTAELYSQTYPLMHTGVEGKPKGVFDQKNQKVDQTYLNKLNQIKPLSNNRFLIVIEGGLYDPANPEQSPIKNGLRQYILDIQAEGKYLPEIFSCNNCTKEEIRNLLSTTGVVGTVFVGSLPSAWAELYMGEALQGEEIFPIDLYFMDLDYDWGEEGVCSGPAFNPFPENTPCFFIREGQPLIHSDIFFGRLTSPLESDEVELLNNYFRKNHLYRIGRLSLAKRALIYIDDVVAKSSSSFLRDVSVYYNDYILVDDEETTSALDYTSRFDDGFEHLFLIAHSNYHSHDFYVPSLQAFTVVDFNQIRDLKPHFVFYTLSNCSNSLYTVENYLSGWYTFQRGDYGLLTLGFTKTVAPRGRSLYTPLYDSLRSTNNFGVAFKNWFTSLEHFGYDQLYLFGGATLIGDPTLALKCQLPTTPVRLNGPQPQGLINYGDPLLQIRDDSDVSSCFPHNVVYSVWPPEEGATAYYRSSGFLIQNPITLDNRLAVPWTVAPVLPPGRYQWRANLKNSAGQVLTKDQVLKVNFTVCSQPSVPQFEALFYGNKPWHGESITLYRNENLTLRIRDNSDRNTTCFPHDVIFNIWERGITPPPTMYVKSSGWMTGNAAIHEPQGTKEWTFRADQLADLPPGEYELRANLDNKSVDRQGNQRTISSRAPQPLRINFTLAERPTPTPTPTPWHTVCKRTLSGHVACINKSGEGENQCSTDLNCETCADSVYGTCTGYCAVGRVCRKGEDNYCACYSE